MKHQSIRRLRTTCLAMLAVIGVAALAMETAYRLTIANLPDIPVPPEPPPPPEVQLLPTWRALGGDDPVKMRAVYPWSAQRLFPIESPDDPSVRTARYVALGLLASSWAQDLPPVPPPEQRRREVALSVWITRNYTARQALGILRTWQGWPAWPETDVVPKTTRVRFGDEYPPLPVPGRLHFPGGSVAVPEDCHAPTHLEVGIDAWMGSIDCPRGLSILVFGGIMVRSACAASPDGEDAVALFTHDGDRLCLVSIEREHAGTDDLIHELSVEAAGTSFTSEIRGPQDALRLLRIGSTFEPSRKSRD